MPQENDSECILVEHVPWIVQQTRTNKKWINELKPDIIFLQECEITENHDEDLMKIEKYTLFTTDKKQKSRLCAYVRGDILCQFKIKIHSSIEMITLSSKNIQIVGFYRPFRLVKHSNQMDYIQETTSYLTRKLNPALKTIIIGDFNLDFKHVDNSGYAHRRIYDHWISYTDNYGLIQLIKEPTWRRLINGQLKESILDHIYTNFDETEYKLDDFLISDHLAVSIGSIAKQPMIKSDTYIRDWKHYSKTNLQMLLRGTEWERFTFMTIEQMSDYMDIELLKALHAIAPERRIKNKEIHLAWSPRLLSLKRKKRNILKKAKKNQSSHLFVKAKEINKQFKRLIEEEKRNKIRKNIKPNDQKSFWRATKIATNQDHNLSYPNEIYWNSRKAGSLKEKADLFSNYFDSKIREIKQRNNPNSYNEEVKEKLIHTTYSSPFTDEKIPLQSSNRNLKNHLDLTGSPCSSFVTRLKSLYQQLAGCSG